MKPTIEGHVPPAMVTKGAVDSFAHLFNPTLSRRDAKRALVRLISRTRVVHGAESMHGIFALVPDGADVLLIARELPGLATLVVVDAVLQELGDEEDEDLEERKAA